MHEAISLSHTQTFDILKLRIDLHHFENQLQRRMAMRSRGGGGGGGSGTGAGARRGTRTGVVRSVYEDFKPLSEWQQDDESHVLNIYLPGV